jgi:CDP-diacylglycerol--glycerol-3-phosphate 3-phosphatidyltransferase
MVSLYQYKPSFQNRLRPLVAWLANRSVTPNQVTVSAIALAAIAGIGIVSFPHSPVVLLALPGVLLGRMALNAIDGMLAREHRLASPLGCWLNEMGDVISDVVLYLPLSLIPGVSTGWVVGVVILAILTEMAGVLGMAIADQRPYNGPMGKSDRAFVFGTVGLLLGLGLAPGFWLTVVLAGVFGLELWTIANRLRTTLQEVQPWQ